MIELSSVLGLESAQHHQVERVSGGEVRSGSSGVEARGSVGGEGGEPSRLVDGEVGSKLASVLERCRWRKERLAGAKQDRDERTTRCQCPAERGERD